MPLLITIFISTNNSLFSYLGSSHKLTLQASIINVFQTNLTLLKSLAILLYNGLFLQLHQTCIHYKSQNWSNKSFQNSSKILTGIWSPSYWYQSNASSSKHSSTASNLSLSNNWFSTKYFPRVVANHPCWPPLNKMGTTSLLNRISNRETSRLPCAWIPS